MIINPNAITVVAANATTQQIPVAGQLVPYQGRPTTIVEKIMRRRVATKSEAGYNNNNIKFLLWLYDDDGLCKDIIKDWMVESMHRAHSEDQEGSSKTKSRMLIFE